MKKTLIALAALMLSTTAPVHATTDVPRLNATITQFGHLPKGVYFGEAAGVAVNSKGHVFVFSRGGTDGPVFGPKAAQLFEFDAVKRNELLVGRDHALACFERAPHPRPSRIEAADELDNDVRVGVEHGFNVLCPNYVRAGPVNPLAGNATIENVCQFEAGGPGVGEDASNRAAHGSETEDGHAQRLQAGAVLRRRTRRSLRRQ